VSSSSSDADGKADAPGGISQQLLLRDGSRLLVREIRPTDHAEIEAAFARLSEDARYTRFFSPVRQLPAELVDATLHPAPERGIALIALDGGTAAGGARYVPIGDGGSCEFAVTVADGWQGRGLARGLMQILIDAARARGLRRIEGFVLPHNTGMRGLAKRLGFSDSVCPVDPGLRLVRLELG
jgi:RimJ/RimL family protein N-acetyltransferase